MLVKVLVGTIVGGIVMYLLGFLVFGILLADYMKAGVHQYAGLIKDPPEHISLFFFNIAWACLLTTIFVKWAGIKDFVSGLSAGAMIFFLMMLGINLNYVAFMNLYIGAAPVLVGLLASTFLGAASGGAIGFVLGKLDKTANV